MIGFSRMVRRSGVGSRDSEQAEELEVKEAGLKEAIASKRVLEDCVSTERKGGGLSWKQAYL